MDSSINIEENNLTSSISIPNSRYYLAWRDMVSGLQKWRIWFLLAYQDIKLRYRRSVIGPFWITISMAITVYSMGFLYAHLFQTNLRQYYPFLVAGMLSWSLISSVITEMSETFIANDGLIKQIKLPYSLHIHRVFARNLLIFIHNIVVMFPIYIIFHDDIHINLNTLFLLPNLFLLYINSITFGMVLAIIGARYRDISQIVKSLIQVAFFVTPVMWNVALLKPEYQRLIMFNPFFILVELLRAPLTGRANPPLIYTIALFFTIVGVCSCAFLFSRYRSRIIYWI